MPQYYGWDVGGAHLKLAVLDEAGALRDVRQIACPLWQGEDRLTQAMETLASEFSFAQGIHAVTMTGELCDLFEDRADGVARITDLMVRALGEASLMIYAGARGWLAPTHAAGEAVAVASQNWHASASWVATTVPDAVLIDIGSTTTDILSIQHGKVAVQGATDAARLEAGELVYSGVSRTPVMAVVREVPMQGRWRAIAAEYFANMADVYRVIGELPAGADQHPTADGRAADLPHSVRRLARMVGEDASTEIDPMQACARFIAFSHFTQLQRGFAQVVSRCGYPPVLVGAGSGEFLVRRLAEFNNVKFVSFADTVAAELPLRQSASTCAPAVALAKLAHSESL
jgi:(4-(4-[2-(gamma-L-glutamylamino)ethyl]phenoxymethyl)furan-2-yl)methanamine synthase